MRNVARMCSELGISSVGERIETESDRRLLIEAGVMYAQGYLYGRPIIDESFFVRGPRALRSAAYHVWVLGGVFNPNVGQLNVEVLADHMRVSLALRRGALRLPGAHHGSVRCTDALRRPPGRLSDPFMSGRGATWIFLRQMQYAAPL
jgi:hypothetical protein